MKFLFLVLLLTVCVMLVTARFLANQETLEARGARGAPDAWDKPKLNRHCSNTGEWCGAASICCGVFDVCRDNICIYRHWIR